jgi:hypothetical protein
MTGEPSGQKPPLPSAEAPVTPVIASNTQSSSDATAQPPQSAPENPSPMLDVHAPHEAVHSWKDFLIHIAAISVGLLIAIGLEQTVEHLHRLHQLDQARRELTTELQDNRKVLDMIRADSQEIKAQLEKNIAVLHASQVSNEAIGQPLTYDNRAHWPLDGAWKVATQNGSLSLMPHAELDRYTYVHEGITATMDALIGLSNRLTLASAIAKRAPKGDYTPRDVEELITATSEAQGRLEYLTFLLRVEEKGLDSALR